MTWPAQGISWCTELMHRSLPAAAETASSTPRRLNSRVAARAQRNCPVRLIEITVFHCSIVILSSGASRCRPALLTQICSVPKCEIACANIAST